MKQVMDLVSQRHSEEIETIITRLIADVKSDEDFPLVYETLEQLKNLCDQSEDQANGIHSYLKSNHPNFIQNTILGHSLAKPYGYSGDFEIINKIYDEHTSNRPQFEVWDKFTQSLCSCVAVRNRRTYLADLVKTMFNNQDEFQLLNLASGPARDLLDVYEQTESSEKLFTTCVDMDPDAIEFGIEVTSAYRKQIKFIEKNIFRFESDQKFDLIWSAGLFDYFNDSTFIRILRRLKEYAKPGGAIVIGNFNEANNPSRIVMELFADWYLHHRTEEQLTNIAIEAGFNIASISVGRENQNVNLFLTIRT